MIEFIDFSCYYMLKKEKISVLENINFQVEEGDFFVITGPSGCGKSTLLKSILGLGGYFSGDIIVNGRSFEDISGKDNVFGYVSQEYSLYPSMTIYENIALPLRVMHTPHEELDARVRSVAKRLNIDWLLTRKPKQLSGGQQQLVAVARALVRNPEVLLMDEPLSNVDPKWRTEMRELLRQINKDYHCTVLFVTHDIPEALYLGDHIMVFGEGQMERIVTPEVFIQVYGNRNFLDFFGEL